MRLRLMAWAMLSASSLTLAGCGITYFSPTVRQQAAGMDVRVVPLTAETVLLANRAPYAPRSLPAAFSQVAGGSGGPRGLGALPEPPAFPEERPAALELRLPPDAMPGPFRLGAGDVIRLASRTAGDAAATALTGSPLAQSQANEFTVRDDGTIALPDIGAIPVEGMTLDEAESAIFERFLDAGIDPVFSLEVSAFNSQRATVGGSVGSPTLVPITLNPVDLGEALTSAGGIQVADEEFASIRIYREGELYQIPLVTFYRQADLQDLPVLPGDAIFVDTSYDLERALAFYRQQIDVISLRSASRSQALSELSAEIGLRRSALEEQRSNFQTQLSLDAVDRDYVYLTGEVNEQSRWPLPFNQTATLADVLYDNGGFSTATGNPAQIYVLRPSTDPASFGAVTAWHLDATSAANLTLAARMEVRPDDIIFIEEQPITRWNRALQQFLPSLISTVSSATE